MNILSWCQDIHATYSIYRLFTTRTDLSNMKADGWATISELADFYVISRNHLVKVVHHLAQQGFIHTQRGKNGGIALARAADQIRIGDVVRKTEPNFEIAECFNHSKNTCRLSPNCGLKSILNEASHAFLATLDRYSG